MKTIIIAEAGVNHNGELEKAIALIDIAADAGADFVKFQTFKAEKLVTPSAQKAEYQKQNLKDTDGSQLAMLKRLEIGEDWYPILLEQCKQKGISFLSTGFDIDSIDFLDQIEVPFFKIPSGEITNKPYLQHIARKGKDVVLSTGMADIYEVKAALEVLEQEGLSKEQITVLHCNTEYPTPMKDVNLLAMQHIARACGVKVGYSDHTLGIEVPIAAVALGAQVIEKHYTLDRTLPGPDHAASLEPDELNALVTAIRNIELALSGDGIKKASPSELKNRTITRKSIVASTFIPKGAPFTSDNITTKRPGSGLSPMLWDIALNKIAIRAFQPDEIIEW